jgi:hypothetical protein
MLMSTHFAMRTVDRYVCARCWGRLIAVPPPQGSAPHSLDVVCAHPESCDGKGFVTARYTERRLTESRAELLEIRINYPQLFPRRPNQTANQILQSLGC